MFSHQPATARHSLTRPAHLPSPAAWSRGRRSGEEQGGGGGGEGGGGRSVSLARAPPGQARSTCGSAEEPTSTVAGGAAEGPAADGEAVKLGMLRRPTWPLRAHARRCTAPAAWHPSRPSLHPARLTMPRQAAPPSRRCHPHGGAPTHAGAPAHHQSHVHHRPKHAVLDALPAAAAAAAILLPHLLQEGCVGLAGLQAKAWQSFRQG